MICANCRVPVAESLARGWIHMEPLPEGAKDHEIVPATPDEVAEAVALATPPLEVAARERVISLRQHMLDNPGVMYSDIAKDAVAMLNQLERVERELMMSYGDQL